MRVEVAISHEMIAKKLIILCFASALAVCSFGELIISFDQMIIDDKVLNFPCHCMPSQLITAWCG